MIGILSFLTLTSTFVTFARGHGVDHGHDGREVTPEFSKEWIVKLEGNVDSAELIAVKFGFVNKGEVRWMEITKVRISLVFKEKENTHPSK